MIRSELFHCSSVVAWKECLSRCGDFDVYHLPEYHLLAKSLGEGEPYLFFFEFDGDCAAFPFLLRPLSTVDGLESLEHNDATAVYGYPGVVTSVLQENLNSGGFKKQFQDGLKKALRGLSVVSLFTRTNPLLPTNWLFDGIAEVLPKSTSVAIDLQKSEVDQKKEITKGHKYDIRKALREGVVVEEDFDFKYIDDFVSIYNETMDRVGSTGYYYFPKDYYLNLKDSLGGNVKLFCAWLDGHIISSSMFFFSNGIVQYHLSGTITEHLRHNGAKVILDHVRTWAGECGYKWLNLGGGVGSSEDSLFRFKAGFSKSRHTFEIVRMIVDPLEYDNAVRLRREWTDHTGLHPRETSFFPEYRAPLTKTDSIPKKEVRS